MFILTILSFSSIIVMGAIMFIEHKIVSDLPEDNSFKKWWRRHIIAEDPEEL